MFTFPALDAYVLLEIYKQLKTKVQHYGLNVNIEPHIKFTEQTSKPKRSHGRGKGQGKKKPQSPRKEISIQYSQPIRVQDFCVLVDRSLLGLGYHLRMCGADVTIPEEGLSFHKMLEVKFSVKDYF